MSRFVQCKNCPDRKTGDKDCHSTCVKYLTARKELDKINETKRRLRFLGLKGSKVI